MRSKNIDDPIVINKKIPFHKFYNFFFLSLRDYGDFYFYYIEVYFV